MLESCGDYDDGTHELRGFIEPEKPLLVFRITPDR